MNNQGESSGSTAFASGELREDDCSKSEASLGCYRGSQGTKLYGKTMFQKTKTTEQGSTYLSDK